MNNQLIEKVIKYYDENCPPLTYKNPILDKTLAGALSKSFVKILKISQQNSNINSNLKLSVLENIRKLCQVESENHLKIDENLTELLTEVYQKNITESSKAKDETDLMLDACLYRRLMGVESDLSSASTANPEIVQALTNLDENGTHLKIISKDIMYWNIHDDKCVSVIKNMWYNSNNTESTVAEILVDNLSLKMKSEIEQILLESCHKLLETKDINLETLFTSDKKLFQIVKISSVSAECFQISCSILNYIFVTKNFNQQFHKFISTFIYYVKLHSPCVSISSLYPSHLSCLVLLLDVSIEDFPKVTKENYVKMTVAYLKSLHKSSENDLIMLLSHFDNWFDIYFESID